MIPFLLTEIHIFAIIKFLLEIVILYFLIRWTFRFRHKKLELDKRLQNRLITEFNPAPIVDDVDEYLLNISKYDIKYEVADYDFFDLKNENKEEMVDVIRNYGIGTCGPPGFYGTLDIHLELEDLIAKKLGVEAAILYANSFTCIMSVITCFCKKYDVIFYHGNSNEAIMRGIGITKSKSIVFYTMFDLLKKIDEYYEEGKRNFIICEGLFKNTGEIIDLEELIKIKETKKLRLILDESLSIPLLGDKGTSSMYNIDITKIDIIIGSLAHVYCGNGAFAAGKSLSVDYQRLSAPSYCFSASLPGFLARNALVNLNRTLLVDMKGVEWFRKYFNAIFYQIVSDNRSPIIVIRRKNCDVSDDLKLNDEYRKMLVKKRDLEKSGIRVGLIDNPIPGVRINLKFNYSLKSVMEILRIVCNVFHE